MPKKEEGITHYTKLRGTIEVGFPNDNVCCQNCEYLWEERGYIKRCRCRLRHDEIVPVDYIAFDRLPTCPLEEVVE